MDRRICFLLLLAVPAAHACTYCDPSNYKVQTLRQEARTSKFIVIGTLANARLEGDQGYTDLMVEKVVKDDPALGKKKQVTLPRWTPLDPKKPSRVMVFFDVYEGKVDPFRGVPLKGTAVGDYLRGAIDLDDNDRAKSLLYYFNFLDSDDPDIAADAFLEFAKASDRDINDLGPRLDPKKIRKLLNDPQTPPDRIGLYAFLLGSCGTRDDIAVLSQLVARKDDRATTNRSGILGGLIVLSPNDGWKQTLSIIEDPQRSYPDKLSALGTIRFFQTCKPREFRPQILDGMKGVLQRGDMADMAIEDLRRWQWWELTKPIIACYGKETHGAPLVKNAIVRYALCSPDEAAATFIKDLRGKEPERIKEIEESIAFERSAPKAPAKP
jgi:hypothetical protein